MYKVRRYPRLAHTQRKVRQPLVEFAVERRDCNAPRSAWFTDGHTASAALAIGQSSEAHGLLAATIVRTTLCARLHVLRQRRYAANTQAEIEDALHDAYAVLKNVDVRRISRLPAHFVDLQCSVAFCRVLKVGRAVQVLLLGVGNVQAAVVGSDGVVSQVVERGPGGVSSPTTLGTTMTLPVKKSARIVLAPGDVALQPAHITSGCIRDAAATASSQLELAACRAKDPALIDSTVIVVDVSV